MGPWNGVLDFSRRVFGITVVLGILFAFLLSFVWSTLWVESGTQEMAVQVETVGLVCAALIVQGVLFNRRRKGTMQFATLVSVLIMAPYTLRFFV